MNRSTDGSRGSAHLIKKQVSIDAHLLLFHERVWAASGPADTVSLSQTNGRARMEHAIAMNCHIRIKGHLDPPWQDWFEGLEIVQEQEGTTLFSGPLQDQADLHGILAKIRGLGLDLLSFDTLEPTQAKSSKTDGREKKGVS